MLFQRFLIFSTLILMTACYAGPLNDDNTTDEINDTTSPTLPTDSDITISNIDDTSATATWLTSTDDTTSEEELEYKVVLDSDLENIDSVEEVDAVTSSEAVMDWTVNTTTVDFTNLEVNSTYFVAVVVRDAENNLSLYDTQSFTTNDGQAPDTSDIAFAHITSTSVTAFWTASEDASTDSTELEYKVVIDTDSSNIDTLDEADAITGDNLLADWTAELTTIDIADLSAGTDYALAVLVKDSQDNKALFAPQNFATVASSGPVSPDDLSIDLEGYTRVDLLWSASSDNETVEANLVYKVVQATDYISIDTISEANAIETTETGLVQDWTANTTSESALNLTPGENYVFTVLVKDEEDNIAIYTPQMATTASNIKRIFSATQHNGNFGGVNGADEYCNNDANKPATGTYKAMIVDGDTRVACTSSNCTEGGISENIGWVLLPETTYVRTDDDSVIGTTTTAAIFDLSLNLNNSFTNSGGEVWTGLSSSWNTSSTCNSWTNDSGDPPYGEVGIATEIDSEAINVYSQTCDRTTVILLCVEQ